MLASELKAVIQELIMYKDYHVRDLAEKMICSIFNGHPYEHPIIGYKHDLWSLNRDSLVNFYKKHYAPNNATLVIVGDVDPELAFKNVENNFKDIKPNKDYKKLEHYVPQDLMRKSVELYRDIEQPVILLAYHVPGSKENKAHLLDVISMILGEGRGSLLYKKLVDKEKLVTSISSFVWDFMDGGLFFIEYKPKKLDNVSLINKLIQEQVDSVSLGNISDKDLLKAVKKIESDYFSLLETNQKTAEVIGSTYLATGDENYIDTYLSKLESKNLKNDIKNIACDYLISSKCNIGKVLPVSETDKKYWERLQKISDQEDQRILFGRVREIPVEPPVHAENVLVKDYSDFNFPSYQSFVLKNGLEVLFFNNPGNPKIDLILDLKADQKYDPKNKSGISNFVSKMLCEGTNKYSKEELFDELETYGMDLGSSSGYITLSLLSADLPKGLEIINEVLANSCFDEKSIEKVRLQIKSNLKSYWDNPKAFIDQLSKDLIYGEHYYSNPVLGTKETIDSISKSDLLGFYKQFISPKGARLAIVGDLSKYNLQDLLDKTLGNWAGDYIPDLKYPEIKKLNSKELNYPINRDQVVLAFAGNSIDRHHEDYDKLLLFNQIFTGGTLSSMSSRLFQLREKSGLFYTIGGSITKGSGEEPGMSYISTIVSLDRLKEAEKAIKDTINNTVGTITDEEFKQAQDGMANSLSNLFESNSQIASMFLFLKEHNLPKDFFDKRVSQLASISKQEMENTAKKYLDADKMHIIRAGRVDKI